MQPPLLPVLELVSMNNKDVQDHNLPLLLIVPIITLLICTRDKVKTHIFKICSALVVLMHTNHPFSNNPICLPPLNQPNMDLSPLTPHELNKDFICFCDNLKTPPECSMCQRMPPAKDTKLVNVTNMDVSSNFMMGMSLLSRAQPQVLLTVFGTILVVSFI